MKRFLFPSSTATDDFLQALIDKDLPLDDVIETPPYVVVDGPPDAEQDALDLAGEFGGYEIWERNMGG